MIIILVDSIAYCIQWQEKNHVIYYQFIIKHSDIYVKYGDKTMLTTHAWKLITVKKVIHRFK